MKKYKTVKEVCALTGLTGKHLYYFHHENVVRATAYANYSVDGNDGYKLYDSQAVEKLQHIALYYRLGLKRNEIRDLMLSPDYDSSTALDRLLTRERQKRTQADQNIAVLNCIKITGTKNGLIDILCRIPWDALCRQAQETPKADALMVSSERVTSLQKLQRTNVSENLLQELFEQVNREEFLYLLGLCVSALSEGTVARDLSPECGKAALLFLVQHPEIYIKYLPATEDA